jgi:hypothetical protein
MSDTAAAWGLGGEQARARAQATQGPGPPGRHCAAAIKLQWQERQQRGPIGGCWHEGDRYAKHLHAI